MHCEGCGSVGLMGEGTSTWWAVWAVYGAPPQTQTFDANKAVALLSAVGRRSRRVYRRRCAGKQQYPLLQPAGRWPSLLLGAALGCPEAEHRMRL